MPKVIDITDLTKTGNREEMIEDMKNTLNFLKANSELLLEILGAIDRFAVISLTQAGLPHQKFSITKSSADDFLMNSAFSAFDEFEETGSTCLQGPVYVWKSGNGTEYIVETACDIEEDNDISVVIYLSKACPDGVLMTYDFETNTWEKVEYREENNNEFGEFSEYDEELDWNNQPYQFTEKQKELAYSNSPERAFLLTAYNTFGAISDSDYQSLKSRWNPLLKLYNQTNKYLQLIFIAKPDIKAPDYDVRSKDIMALLVADDECRYGMAISCSDKNEYILYQYLDSLDFIDSDDEEQFEMYFREDEYLQEVGRTNNLGQMKACAYRMANRYSGYEDTYTIPLSLSAYMETTNANRISARCIHTDGEKRELTPAEQKHLEQAKKALRRMAQY